MMNVPTLICRFYFFRKWIKFREVAVESITFFGMSPRRTRRCRRRGWQTLDSTPEMLQQDEQKRALASLLWARTPANYLLPSKLSSLGLGKKGRGWGVKEDEKMAHNTRTDNFQEFLAFPLKRERRCVMVPRRYQTTHTHTHTHTHTLCRPRFFAPSKRCCCKPH